VGAPAVLVPYPHHADRQQFRNAEPLVARGGALVIEEQALTPAAVRDVLLPLLFDAPRLAEMSSRMRVGYRDATAAVVEDLLFRWGREGPIPRCRE
jgi:UDP-N-acetylglucosamine--N-acetylmuramyl-(pentapeptide) pyrophosphoryl-undecaprenol N-acetylglucosamine transferase